MLAADLVSPFGAPACIIMAIHWSLTILVPRAKSMTSAVTNVIPDFKS